MAQGQVVRHVTAETTSWVQQSKPSNLVVLGNGPVYSHLNDPFFGHHARFFSNPDDVTVVTHSWQYAPTGGAVNYTTDVRSFSAKVFDTYLEFVQQYRPSPRAVTDYTQGNADIFHSHDIYGWPPDPVPIYWSPGMLGTSVVLNSGPPYLFANDVWLLKKQDKTFDTYQEYFTAQRSLAQSLNTYLTYLDFSWVKPQAKVFDTYQEFYRSWQQGTGNAIFSFVSYNPATDVTRFKPQAKHFGEFEPFFRGQPLTRNVLENLPPTYDFRSMFFFRRPDTYQPPPDPNYFSITQRGSLASVVSPLLLMPNIIGMDLLTAENAVQAVSLVVGNVVFEDSVYPIAPKPRGIVIGQWPLPGAVVTISYPVLIIVSSGLMRLPDVGDSTNYSAVNVVIGDDTPP